MKMLRMENNTVCNLLSWRYHSVSERGLLSLPKAEEARRYNKYSKSTPENFVRALQQVISADKRTKLVSKRRFRISGSVQIVSQITCRHFYLWGCSRNWMLGRFLLMLRSREGEALKAKTKHRNWMFWWWICPEALVEGQIRIDVKMMGRT